MELRNFQSISGVSAAMIHLPRRPVLLSFASLWVAAMSLAACASAATPSATPVASPSATSLAPPASVPGVATIVSDGANGISFQRPAAWVRWQPNQSSPAIGGPLIYLSTDPLLPICATAPDASPNPPDAQGTACGWPLTTLSPTGVLVAWVNTRILRTLPTTGEVLPINGSRARLQIERPGVCDAVGADETISVLVPIGQPTPLSNIEVVVCLRGSDLAAAEAQVRTMLASATVTHT
jgi:hypothetical protein